MRVRSGEYLRVATLTASRDDALPRHVKSDSPRPDRSRAPTLLSAAYDGTCQLSIALDEREHGSSAFRFHLPPISASAEGPGARLVRVTRLTASIATG